MLAVKRKKAGMSQHLLAKLSGVPRWRITLIEQGYAEATPAESKAMRDTMTKYKGASKNVNA